MEEVLITQALAAVNYKLCIVIEVDGTLSIITLIRVHELADTMGAAVLCTGGFCFIVHPYEEPRWDISTQL